MGHNTREGPPRRAGEHFLLGLGMAVVLLTFLVDGWENNARWIVARASLAGVGLVAISLVTARIAATQLANRRLFEEVEAQRVKSSAGYEFLGTLAREMRGNLLGIAGRAAILEDLWDHLEEDARRNLMRRIAERTIDLVRLVGDVLDFSKDGGPASPRPCNLASESKVVLERFTAEPDNIELAAHIPTETYVLADAAMLRRTLELLLSRAAKTSVGKLRIRARSTGKRVVICVDTHEADVIRLDEPEEFDSKLTSANLANILVRRLVESMGGEFNIEISPARGHTYSVSLPRADVTL